MPFLGFGPLLKSRSPLKVDRIWAHTLPGPPGPGGPGGVPGDREASDFLKLLLGIVIFWFHCTLKFTSPARGRYLLRANTSAVSVSWSLGIFVVTMLCPTVACHPNYR